MSRLLVIWGAGGHGKVVLDVARSAGCFDRVVFFDDDLAKSGRRFFDCEMIHEHANLAKFSGESFVVAVGQNSTRARCFDKARVAGLSVATLVHKSAVISPSASIGCGTVVMACAVVNAGAVIAEDCIINTSAVVEHDCTIGSHAHISPGAILGGCARVGLLAHVGIGAVVLPGAIVGEESIVGAGAVLLREAVSRSTVIGVPAKALI